MDIAKAAVLQKTTLFFENKDKESLIVRGYDFNRDVERSSQDSNEKEISIDYEGLFASYKNIGYQGTSVGRAIEEINKMVSVFNVTQILSVYRKDSLEIEQ